LDSSSGSAAKSPDTRIRLAMRKRFETVFMAGDFND
jgi:hypothetical protein